MCEGAVVPGYYLVCYNTPYFATHFVYAVVPGYYLVCYNVGGISYTKASAVVPGYYLVCYNNNQRLIERFWL